jgi:cell division protein ZapA
MTTSKTINVTIMGREFRVACPDDEREELLQSVSYLDKKMREIRDSGKVIGSERVAIMAALNITHELLTTRIRGHG